MTVANRDTQTQPDQTGIITMSDTSAGNTNTYTYNMEVYYIYYSIFYTTFTLFSLSLYAILFMRQSMSFYRKGGES